MRFSAPTREPPGGRPSRGAKLKGRGCTRQRDARNENRLGGTGAAKKAPSEQGATKAAGHGAEDARLEPRQWSAAERVSRDRRRKRRCCARPLMKAKAHGACGAQHFVFINARYSLAHTKAGARSGDAGNTDFPLGFLLGGLCGGQIIYSRQVSFLSGNENNVIIFYICMSKKMIVMLINSKKNLILLLILVLGILPLNLLYSQEPIVIEIESLSKPDRLLWMYSKEEIWDALIRSEVKVNSYDPFDNNIVVMGEAPNNLVYKGFHPFLQGMYEAYSEHRPFVLSPDMINLLICQGFSKHINVNSEALRDKFTDSPDKVALTIQAEGDLVYDSINWGAFFDQFSEQIAFNAGQELVDAMTNDFSTTGLSERIASQITLMDATKPYFDFYATYCVCGIPEVTLLGTTEDWQKLYDHLSVYEKYDLRWWTKELRPVIKKIIEAAQGKKDVAFWRNMFKVHTSDKYGDLGAADGWILKFFPYDSDGNRLSMRRLKVNDISLLPHEMVKVEVVYQIKDDNNCLLKEIPLEAWAGFVGLEQNKNDFTLKPVISWMVRKKESDDSALVRKIQVMNRPSYLDDGLILTNVTEVPSVLKHFNLFFSLGLYFKDQVFIPDWMKDIEIGFLTLNGDITRAEKKKILEWFPNTTIIINGEQCQEGIYKEERLTCLRDEYLEEFYHEAEELSKMEKIWILYIDNFYNDRGNNKELILPESLEKVEISYLDIEYPISDKSLQRIMEQFPNTIIYMNGKVIDR